MTHCSNCGSAFNASTEGLHITSGPLFVAAICPSCCEGVRVAKIAIKRPEVGGFQYDQWHPLEMMSGGLTTPRRAG